MTRSLSSNQKQFVVVVADIMTINDDLYPPYTFTVRRVSVEGI